MTEVKYQISKSNFNDLEVEFLVTPENDFWITSTEIARALNINTSSVWKIYNRHKDVLESHSSIANLDMGDRPRDTRIFDKTGCIFIGIRSNSDEAIPFQEWVLNVIDNIVKKGFHIEKANLSPMEIIQQQNAFIGQVIQAYVDQEKEIKEVKKQLLTFNKETENVKKEVKNFEKKYEDERVITPQTKRKFQDLVHLCVIRSGHHYAVFHKLYKDEFKISAYKDAPEKLGQKILRWMVEHPKVKPHIKGLDLDSFLDFDYGFKEDD